MATERFEKLSDDKKNRILEAAQEEFARVPFEEASINQIIKNAGISRGSFYTYFEDKNDLLQYIFRREEEGSRAFLRELVLENEGDFWKAITEWTYKVAGYMKKGSLNRTINIICNTGVMKRVVNWVERESGLKKEKEEEQIDWLMEHLDLSLLDIDGSREKFKAILKSAQIVASLAVLNLIIYPERDVDMILRQFNMQMDILRFGADSRKNINRSVKS